MISDVCEIVCQKPELEAEIARLQTTAFDLFKKRLAQKDAEIEQLRDNHDGWQRIAVRLEAERNADVERLRAERDELLAVLKEMRKAPYDQPISAWFGLIHTAIAEAEKK